MNAEFRTRALDVGIDADELRRASPESRSVSASLSSDAPITRYGEIEVLSHAPGAIDLSRAEGGLPLLIGHDDSGIPIGRIDGLHVTGGRLRGTLTFATGQRADEALQAVRDGVLRSTSVRYRPLAIEPILEDGRKTGVTIAKWQLVEASLVAVPADHTVGVGRSAAGSPASDQPSNDFTGEKTMSYHARRGGPIGAAEPNEAPADTIPEVDRLRVVDQLCRTLHLDDSHRQMLAGAADKTIPELREMALNEAVRISELTATRSAAAFEQDYGYASPRDQVRLMAEGLSARFAGGEVSEAARPYARMRMTDLARQCLETAGVRTSWLSDSQLVSRALHGTSDFKIVLGDSIGRAVAQAYSALPTGLKACGRERQAQDFRAMTSVRLSEAPSLEKVNESGEFHRGTVDETGEAFKLDTYGRIFAITRQALVNDDLGVFDGIRAAFVAAAAEREAKVLTDLLASNPTMSDTKALFHTDHGNLAGSAGALSDLTLSAARLAMRLQKGLAGTPIDAAPK